MIKLSHLLNIIINYSQYGTRTSETKNWVEALASCKKRGGDLESFHSQEEIDAFIKNLDGKSSHNLFIGLASDGFREFYCIFLFYQENYAIIFYFLPKMRGI